MRSPGVCYPLSGDLAAEGDFWALFGAIAAITFGIRTMGAPKDMIVTATLFSLAFAVMATILLVWGFVEKDIWDELNEFKNNATIKGIKARQIFGDLEGTKV